MSGLRSWLGLLAELGKARISLLACFTAAMGHALALGRLHWSIAIPAIGTYVLALGSSSLNEYQERAFDAQMPRTRRRPIPSGRIGATAALAIALAEILLGSVILLFSGSLWAWSLGLFAVLWYNGVYTPLKRRTAFAVFPGSLIGAIPPIIGWTAAGGSPLAPPILAVAFFFFIWQVPHFMLLLFRYGNEYEEAGYPTLTGLFEPQPLQRMTFIWIVAAAVSSLLLPLFGAVQSLAVFLALALVAIWLVARSAPLLGKPSLEMMFPRAFGNINLFAVVVILASSVDGYLR